MSKSTLPPLLIPRLSRQFHGAITLDGSKSISNRALTILALAGADANEWLSGLSTSQDTLTLRRLLSPSDGAATWDAGDAGTVFRFMAAFLATRPGTQTLTGSARMQERPIGPLVEALRSLGADIEYLGKNGYPPLRIGPPSDIGVHQNSLSVNAGVSSQFLSALLMIGPYLPKGLTLIPDGKMVSRPYLDLTLHLMRYFGAQCGWEGENIVVYPGAYQPRPLQVEADWSAASYWYSCVALAEEGSALTLKGLLRDSWQGDAVVQQMMERFGVSTDFTAEGVRITKMGPARPVFEWDFLTCPDIAQTLAVTCAASGVQGIFSGLETLSIKETDRIAALKQELGKTGVSFAKLPPHFNKKRPDAVFYLLEGQAHWENTLEIATYGDHRMAMAFAPLAVLGPVSIANPDVVKKSYPDFWKHLDHIHS